MRALPLAVLLAALAGLAGCVVVPARPYAPPPPPPPGAPPPPPAEGFISERQAVDIAFGIARERGLGVDHVRFARLDGRGRWHVELRGRGDRARVVLDGRDGRLLHGKFRGEDREDRDDERGDD